MPMVMVGISAMPCPQAEMNPYVKATHGRPLTFNMIENKTPEDFFLAITISSVK